MLLLCYWHEYLDVLFLFKCSHGLLKTDILPEQVVNPNRDLRSNNSHLVTYNIHKFGTFCHQNSFVIRVSRIRNALPDELRDAGISFLSFWSCPFSYYHCATQTLLKEESPRGKQFAWSVTEQDNLINTMNKSSIGVNILQYRSFYSTKSS